MGRSLQATLHTGRMESEKRGFFDLQKQFIFYASYHNNSVNVVIHLICIWSLLASGLFLFHIVPLQVPPPDLISPLPLVGGLPLDLAGLITLIYVVSYILMDPLVGSLGALLVLLLNKSTYHLVSTSGSSTLMGMEVWHAVLAFHVFCWILQFIGHAVFEKRAPALLDSWDQAFITAPLFVLLEIAFFFGYRSSFYKECMVEVDQEIRRFKTIKAQ